MTRFWLLSPLLLAGVVLFLVLEACVPKRMF